jgi:hypothetical protein
MMPGDADEAAAYAGPHHAGKMILIFCEVESAAKHFRMSQVGIRQRVESHAPDRLQNALHAMVR